MVGAYVTSVGFSVRVCVVQGGVWRHLAILNVAAVLNLDLPTHTQTFCRLRRFLSSTTRTRVDVTVAGVVVLSVPAGHQHEEGLQEQYHPRPAGGVQDVGAQPGGGDVPSL